MTLKKRFIPLLGSAAVSLSILTACQSTPTSSQVASSMVDNVVLPSYSKLHNAAKDLEQALEDFAQDPTNAHLKEARSAWKAARKTWEVTETWAYGPAETLDFDPNLDDWPVSKSELSSALNSSSAFTEQALSRLGTTSRGFHGIEYVLFSHDDASAFSKNERSYLQAAVADLENNAGELLASWSGSEGFGAVVIADPEAAIADILAGMEGCLAEVADGKLGGAFDTSNAGELESVFSGNTGTDILFNIYGVKSAWEKSGVSSYVDSSLSQRLSQQLNTALKLAKSLPSKLNDKLEDQGVQKKVNSLREALTEAAETTVAISKTL